MPEASSRPTEACDSLALGSSPPDDRNGVDRLRRRTVPRAGAAIAAVVLGSAAALAVSACGEDREGSVENIGGETGATTGGTVGTGQATAPTGTTTGPSRTTTSPSGGGSTDGE